MQFGEAAFLFRCDAETGWKLLHEGRPRAITARAGHFLPTIIEFLRRRPRLKESVFVILQVRAFREGPRTTIGTLLLLQEGMSTSGDEDDEARYEIRGPRLLAPASYVEDDFESLAQLKIMESKRLRQMIGPAGEQALDVLSNSNWSYDLVLELCQLDERVDSISSGSGDRAFISARVKPVQASGESAIFECLWRPGVGTNGNQSIKDSICIPWFPPAQRMRAEAAERCVVYLMPGSRARQVLRETDQVWQRPSTRNLLLAAEPGSGKEVVSRLVHFGRAGAKFVSSSVGGESWDGWQIQLLGQGQPQGPAILRGFIEEASGGTLLVDEIEKADRRIRDALLRIIEADEFYRPGSVDCIKFRGERRPLFIFAGSGNGSECRRVLSRFRESGAKGEASIRQLYVELELTREPRSVLERMEIEPPRDFWQRMDRRITFSHPLGEESDWDDEAFRQYVDLFLWRARESKRQLRETPFAADRLLLLQHMVAERGIIYNLWPEVVESLAKAIVELNCGRRPGFREIRSAASELYDQLWGLGRSGRARNLRRRLRSLAACAVKRSRGEGV